jgi:hypothetical protein
MRLSTFLPAAINEVDGLRHWNDNVTRGSAALRTLVTRVVLIASRDGFCNPVKPNSQDYHNKEGRIKNIKKIIIAAGILSEHTCLYLRNHA